MSNITGVVEGVSKKFPPKVGLLVNGSWYNSDEKYLPNPLPQKGDTIEFTAKGKFCNGVKIVGGGGVNTPAPSTAPKPSGGRTFPVGVTAPERTINRQNALTNAVNYIGMQSGTSPEDVIGVARKFEAYTTGDLDLEEAKESLAEMGLNGEAPF